MPDAPAVLNGLPHHLAERVRPLSAGACEGAFILYWLRTAQRAHDNPALDAALAAGDALGLPVFVYHALSERYPYASDRHHTFILEGARDVHRALRARGVGAAFHLERPGHRGPHLRTLAERAALVLTEDLPVPPLTTWTARLRDAVDTPVWAVDTACVLPMLQVPPGIDRAYAFRERTAAARDRRIDAGWTDHPVTRPDFTPDDLPFTPVDLDAADIATLVAACEIDHTVGPVPHTRGGTVAGQARWAAFRDGGGLDAYARTRNAPHRDGVSRLSAYLHYGMVSPLRLAQDARDHGGKGAAKWIDELLVWRELAHVWCSEQADLHTTAVLPGWARATLQRHASDPRPARFDDETLARGATGDALWDACQRSLLVHGELHNNVRMTWGKQIVGWSTSAEEARSRLVDLNHRYALDGRDPNSYGGLYWCLGLFDRPFRPGRPVTGELRSRDTAVQARRIALPAYRDHVRRPLRAPMPRVAVIGAGIAGLTAARTLRDHGFPVTVFDKSRGPSGRMSTRRAGEGAQFDHGAQYFTARDPAFRWRVRAWAAAGVVARWEGRFGTLEADGFAERAPPGARWVGAPRMSRLGRHLAEGLSLESGVRITALERAGHGWTLRDADGADRGHFDRVLVAVPAPQAAPLLAVAPDLAAQAAAAPMVACQALMLGFDAPLDLPFDGVRVSGGPLAWIARDSTKPGRPAGERWVVHATPDHSATHLEEDGEATVARLLAAFQERTGVTASPTHAVAHRWRFARPAADRVDGPRALYDPALHVGAAGDWLVGARVEAAWQSGAALAGHVLGRLVSAS
ncbi:MAG: FAD-dependent oxidoreductase [Myxococcota bacterium]|nr:FAD-dependent oxidoreductase [Myxococcota bacterium]